MKMLVICARCRKEHDGNFEGGWCMVCNKEFCDDCSMWEEERDRRECRSCECRISKGQGTWIFP